MKKKQAEPPATPAAETPAPATGPVEGTSESRDSEIERLRAREDELLRALAELQNVNRRRKQEAETALRYAADPFLIGLLPVLDDLERALRAFPNETDPLRVGVALVQERLVALLQREGLEAIRPHGEPFDPELHDAIAHIPIPGAAAGTVVEVAAPGYRFRDRVLRHAKVVVAAETDAASVEAPASPAGGAKEPDGGGL